MEGAGHTRLMIKHSGSGLACQRCSISRRPVILGLRLPHGDMHQAPGGEVAVLSGQERPGFAGLAADSWALNLDKN